MASNDNNYPPNSTDNMSRNRRSSVTSATLSSIFRSNSTSSANNGTPAFPGPITSAAMDQNRRRRLSVSTTAALGLSGATAGNGGASAGPNTAFAARRASMSTNSSTSDTAFDENAIEDDDAPAGSGSRNSPNTQFARRMSFGAQAMRNLRGSGGTSPGGTSSNGRQRSNLSSTATTATAAAGGGKQSQQQQQQQQPGSAPPRSSSPLSPSSSSYVSPRSPISIPTQRNASRGPSFSYSTANQASSHYAPVLSPRTASDKMFFPAARADQGYNWPEQLRSRAESSVASGARPSFSFASGMGNSPPRGSGFGSMSSYTGSIPGGASGGVGNGGGVGMRHDRAKSVSDIPAPPPAQRPAPQPRQAPRPKPDHFQERILKGDFYMD
ncbi:hypothetical protein Sste5346_000338 [Sporothrix stenoceras]|uniref:Uncharacterized protein n=1 Tax=Sporothrix stenoceras TaxID=5173 RepID=A0ABR3ZRF3_9PEZI